MNKLSGRVLMHKTNDFVENCTFKTNENCKCLTIDEIKQKWKELKQSLMATESKGLIYRFYFLILFVHSLLREQIQSYKGT